MSAILDLITGGDLLPQVYCKKVTLENHPKEATDTLVTLNFELYQKASSLTDSNWLNNLNVLGADIYDSMFIQIIAYSKKNNIKKLLAGNKPAPSSVIPVPPNKVGNVYVLQQQAGDGHLPRRDTSGFFGSFDIARNDILDQNIQSRNDSPLFETESKLTQNLDSMPIRLKNSSILSTLANPATKKFLQYVSGKQLKPREETINGQVYYVVPFTQTFRFRTGDTNPPKNLGFLFYTMLDIPDFLEKTGINYVIKTDALLEKYILEGPVNTEIVFMNGKPAIERETFFLPNGKKWEGSVHLHTSMNPAPDGYAGDGSLGENKGWMAGARHLGMADQPKLSLRSVPNYKIQDFRSDVSKQPLDTFLGFGTDAPVFSLNANVQGTVNKFLSPFQKETRKYLSKFGGGKSTLDNPEANYNAVGVSYYDNDAEFSKLYLSRDRNNSARGMFFINIEEFLRNNSKIYPMILDTPKNELSADPYGQLITLLMKKAVATQSKILEIKLYRDRVKKKKVSLKTERYANDTSYEEPSHLVGTFYDIDGYQTPSQTSGISEITLGGDFDPLQQRFFMFSDIDVGKKSAGLYQYRIEVEFQDGTYRMLNDILKALAFQKSFLRGYYNFATSYFSMPMLKVIPGGHSQARKPYFQNGSFHQKFQQDLAAHPTLSAKPWEGVLKSLLALKYIFGISTKSFDVESLAPMIDPVGGSPQGINFVIKIVGSVITKLEDLLDVNRLSKSGSELDSVTKIDGYNFNNFLDYQVSSTDTRISDEYSFNNLFEAVSNENIYSSYLDISSDFASSGHFAHHGLRRINTTSFIRRCQLDTAKFMQPLGPNSFQDAWTTQVISQQYGDYLANSGYSYLSPSIVEFADSLQGYDPDREKPRSFHYLYKAFRPYAEGYLGSVDLPNTSMYSNVFANMENYEKLLIALMIYGRNKKNNPDADLVDSFSIGPTHRGNANSAAIETREAYKNLFEDSGLVIHSMKNYDKFFGKDFDKQSGVTGPDNISDKEEYHSKSNSVLEGTAGLWLDDYSDGNLETHKYLQKLLFNQQTVIPRPSLGKLYDTYSAQQSNIHKALWMNKNVGLAALNNTFKTVFAQALTDDNNVSYLAFFFFHLTMTARIDVFSPTSSNSVAKDDEENWTLLGREHIENMTEEKNLFCRLVLPQEVEDAGIKIPILDKYFLISGNPVFSTSYIATQALAGNVGSVSYDVATPTQGQVVETIVPTTAGTAASQVASSGYDASKNLGGETGGIRVGIAGEGKMTDQLSHALFMEQLENKY